MSQASHTTPRITYSAALAVFDSPADMARKLGVSRASVSEWKEEGCLPEGRVWQMIVLFPKKFGYLRPRVAA